MKILSVNAPLFLSDSHLTENLQRYRRRWIVERTFAWVGHFGRLVLRYERLITTYAGFFHLACAMLTLRRVLK